MDEIMIRNVARKLFRQYVAGTEHEARVNLDDLIQTGVLGWLEAEQRVDGDLEGDSKSFFYINVQGRMLDQIRKLALVRMPQIPYSRLKELMAAKIDLEKKGIVVDGTILALELGWQVEEVEKLLASIPTVISADRSRRREEDETSDFYDTFLTEKQPLQPQLDKVMKGEVADLIEHCLSKLESARMRFIISARYLEEIKLRDLAERFGCTPQTVHYQEKKGLKNMRSCLEKNGWQWDESDDQI